MSIVLNVKIDYAKVTQMKLNALDKKVRLKVVSKALRAGAKVIQQRAKANAPVRTGILKRAITVRASKYIGKRKKQRGEVAINAQIGAGNFKGKTFYGAFQEFGWKSGWRGQKRGRKQIEGKHFMQRAGDQSKSEVLAVILSTLKAGIEEAAKS